MCALCDHIKVRGALRHYACAAGHVPCAHALLPRAFQGQHRGRLLAGGVALADGRAGAADAERAVAAAGAAEVAIVIVGCGRCCCFSSARTPSPPPPSPSSRRPSRRRSSAIARRRARRCASSSAAAPPPRDTTPSGFPPRLDKAQWEMHEGAWHPGRASPPPCTPGGG